MSKKIIKKNSKFQDYLKNPNRSTFFLNETEPGEIMKIINNLDTKKSGDIYSISPKNVKQTGQAVSQCLTIIFNRCILEGHFPTALKKAKVIPLHKGDSVLSVSNYRPISLLPIFSKIFERLIYDQLIQFLDRHKILDELQFGFQKNKSTENAISAIVKNITEASTQKQSSYCIFLDFAKAFDTVNHGILIDKLSHYGVKTQTLSLFKSYLSNRSQVVEVNNTTSSEGIIQHGVPQGSILGPLLFLLYINDISKSSRALKFFLFADDTTVYYSNSPNEPNTENILNTELEKVACWLSANKLSLNVKKSSFLHYHHGKTKKNSLKLYMNGSPIDEKETTKYLGTFLDNKLTWKTQIEHIKLTLAKNIGMISKIRHYAKDACKKLFHSLIISHINYNVLNWSCTHKTNLDCLEKKIKKGIRIISFSESKNDHTSPLFRQHNILPFHKHIELRRACFMWKVEHNLIPDYIKNLFNRNPHNQKFIVPHVNTEKEKNRFIYQCTMSWRNVPDNIKKASTYNSFTVKYRNYLLETIPI